MNELSKTLMVNSDKCVDCTLCSHDVWERPDKDKCSYWGFNLYPDQRACKHYVHKYDFEKVDESKVFAYPLGEPMKSISFPKELCTVHDYSDKRHTLKIETICVNGVWYSDIHYQRHYDSMYGHSFAVSIYDGDYATEEEAIQARMRQVLKEETYYRCAEACEFIKSKMLASRQLSLF